MVSVDLVQQGQAADSLDTTSPTSPPTAVEARLALASVCVRVLLRSRTELLNSEARSLP